MLPAANAIQFSAGDIGPIQERYTTMSWEIGDACGEIELKVRYRINYASVRDRGLGRNPDVNVLAVYVRNEIDEWRIARVSSAQWAAVVSLIEIDELPQD
jgi:hypothetical protein